jgi:hypothetical protein
MKKLYRGPYIDAFCQVWFHLVQLFQRSTLKYEKLTDAKLESNWPSSLRGKKISSTFSVFSNSGHVGWMSGLPDTIFKGFLPSLVPFGPVVSEGDIRI